MGLFNVFYGARPVEEMALIRRALWVHSTWTFSIPRCDLVKILRSES